MNLWHFCIFLDPEDLAFLMNHLKPIASHWRDFGLQLGMLDGELSTIEATPLLIPGGPVAFLREVLSKWLDRAPPFPTLTKLCGALRSHAVDKSRLALELEQHYQSRRTGLSAHACNVNHLLGASLLFWCINRRMKVGLVTEFWGHWYIVCLNISDCLLNKNYHVRKTRCTVNNGISHCGF